jgi:monoamine oxidase
MAKESYHVPVIGAGAAGLMAVRRLAQASLRLALLEARDRLGGRIHTLSDPLFPLLVELGPEFIHGTAPMTFELLREAGMIAVDSSEGHASLKGGKPEPTDDFFERVGKVMQELSELGSQDVSFAEFLMRF